MVAQMATSFAHIGNSGVKTCPNPEQYLNLNLPRHQRSAYIKLRCGVLPLEIETGRYHGVALEDRICKLCDLNQVEDETHFLINCPLYSDYRRDMFDKALEIDVNFMQKESE